MKKMKKYKIISVICLLTWLFLLAYAVFDNIVFTNELGVIEVLEKSSFARIMFNDIGGLSTAASAWIIFATKLKIRWFFAILILFTGSFALFPYLSIYFWDKATKESP